MTCEAQRLLEAVWCDWLVNTPFSIETNGAPFGHVIIKPPGHSNGVIMISEDVKKAAQLWAMANVVLMVDIKPTDPPAKTGLVLWGKDCLVDSGLKGMTAYMRY